MQASAASGEPDPIGHAPNVDAPQKRMIDSLLTALRAEIEHDPKVSLLSSRVSVDSLAKKMAATLPRTQESNAMAEKVGPFYEPSGLMAWLDITKQGLGRRRESDTIIGCKTQEGYFVYPVWQFQDDGTLIPGLREVLKVLATGIKDGWTWALWLTSEVPGQLDGKSAVQWLTEGRDPQAVLNIARGDATAWAA
ncbi:hypothetical protein IWX65_003286 [Arthrobacter sp. CAN_A214]|uniref:hypothetical protein n=1 Tax=Arthrobacter sp. CAN_A214 TaxID=2787720 RepID=UPI0018CBDB86